ncbi:DUF1553 domain-containing protein [Armatimonas rosea]|uniref:Mono/diheme cytochrome c family protein n=1 Tax=Armatimonas rosea TaxID=685828 RepID=A0A7W9STI0_ARMRO|nr:DUF1553 domain-containing protein [Armatimonas rosea]MBB6052567.1 mono/diheme cytochrome c family protein [Armatimonas rosea]
MHRRAFTLASALSLAALATAQTTRTSPAPSNVALGREARRILSENCFACHGPDEKQRKAGLRLDGPNRAVVPGDILASALVQRIAKPDSDPLAMPPAMSHKSLTPTERQLLMRWIGEGAAYEKHWAFSPLPASLPPAPSLPHTQRVPATFRGWKGGGEGVGSPLPSSPRSGKQSEGRGRGRDAGRDAIDGFIRARLAQERLAPSPEADKRTLIRRVSLDLTGLPPTPERVAAFVKDTRPDAYERLVEELLASPHYGERMAIGWLDLARYADTHGYHIDPHRDMYRWRDWVIAAFNTNKPYDQFVVEQLAGDLLPNATRDQIIATGFNRNHPINFEGGAIPEEYLTAYVADRVDTTATAFLGLTLRCAQCHDHKYDPLTQKDYYRLFAYFNNNDEVGLDGTNGNAKPFIKAPYPEQEARLAELETLQKTLTAKVTAKESGPVAIPTLLASDWDKQLAPGLQTHLTFGSPNLGGGGGDGIVSGALALNGSDAKDYPGLGEFEGDQAFSYGCWVWPEGGSQALFSRMDNSLGVRGWDLYLADGQPMAHFIHNWPDSALRADSKERLPMGKWSHVFVTYDGSGKLSGVRIYVNGKPTELTAGADSLKGTIKVNKPLRLGGRDQATGFKGKLDDIRIYSRVLSPADVALLVETDPLRPALAAPADKRTPEQQRTLARYALRSRDPEYRVLLENQAKAAAEKDALEKAIPTTMVMQERKEKRPTFLLDRGQYDRPKERVEPGLPAVFTPFAKPEGVASGASGGRLDLAKWLVSPENPLTARVAVNRLWQQFFGVGLVKTSENFGVQGEAPSHPELLDWLATDFRDSGWDVKRLVRQIVTSATYRQHSETTPALLQRDPENRLLARAPRLRLPAELVRDQALAVSGLLVPKIGGPSVKPYQPAGLWEEMSFKGNFSAQTYEQDHGEKLYRRSMYTFWKRTVPPPSLQTFDAPEREFCIVRRSATNTPLQALILLNDPTYVEAARKLAERLMHEAPPSNPARIASLYSLLLARAPRPDETALLLTILNRQTTAYRKAPENAKKLLMVGESPVDTRLDPIELAAWATVCSTVLNLDEAITRG